MVPMPADRPTIRIDLARIDALDGLRAIAIALVLAFHLPYGFGSLDAALLRGGFIAVDLFFVLSGFLITLVLLPPGRPGPPALGKFLVRRVTRLLPAFYGFLGVAALVGLLDLSGTNSGDLWRQIALTAVAAINWPFALGEPAPATYVSHTWSLALEWQWYVAWSLIVWVAVRLGARLQVLMYGALAGAAAVNIWRSVYWSTGIAEERLYFGFDTRGLDAFLIGAVVALALQLYGPPATKVGERFAGAAAGLALAVIAGLTLTQPTRDEFWYRDAGLGMIAIAAAALVFYAATAQRGVLRTLLASPPFLGLGRMSYSVYLWHWPVFVLTAQERTGWTFLTAVAVRLPVTLLLSATSYFVLERPFLRRRRSAASPGSLPSEPAGGGNGRGHRPRDEDEPTTGGSGFASEHGDEHPGETGRGGQRRDRRQPGGQAGERHRDTADEEKDHVGAIGGRQSRLSA